MAVIAEQISQNNFVSADNKEMCAGGRFLYF
jgi:hypothetical protein